MADFQTVFFVYQIKGVQCLISKKVGNQLLSYELKLNIWALVEEIPDRHKKWFRIPTFIGLTRVNRVNMNRGKSPACYLGGYVLVLLTICL